MLNCTRIVSSDFQYAKISKYGTFKFKDFSKTFKSLEIFFKIQRLSKTSQGPYKPWERKGEERRGPSQ